MSFNGDLNAGDAGEDLTTKGDLHGFDTINTRIPVGADGTVLTADSTAALGLAYSTSAANVLTTQGDVLYHNASGLARLAAGVSGQALQTQGAGADPIWASAAAATVDPNIVDMVYSTTIGDYSQPSGATASSEGSTTTNGWYTEGIGNDYTYTEYITGYSSGQNGGHWLNPSYAVDQDTGTAATFDMGLDGINSLKTQGYYVLDFQTEDTIANRPINVNWKHLNYSGFYSNTTNLSIEGSTDGISYTNIGSGSVNAYNTSIQNTAATAFTYRYIKLKWEGWNNWRVYFYFVAKNSTPATPSTVNHTAASAVDDDLSTYWASNAETNPWIYVDNGSTSNFNSIALYPNADSTETEIKIQLSASTAFAGEEITARTITYSDLTNGAWNFVRFNNNAGMRYARVYGSSGASSVLGFNEIKLLNFSDAEVGGEHGHLSISGTDTSLALDGT